MRLAASLLVAGLLSTGCSQIVIVPPAPDGSSTTVDVAWEKAREKGNTSLDRHGYAFYVDRIQDVVYRISEEDIEAQFGPALNPMREILAAGLPELPHSYAALMASERGPLGSLAIELNTRAPVVLEQAGQGMYIDGYPNLPHAIDPKRLAGDFAPALEAQTATLEAMRSYLALLEPPDGYQDRLTYRFDGKEYVLERPGQGLTLDGIEHQADADEIERDFGPALAAQREILAAGLPELPHSYAALLEHATGALGDLTYDANDAGIRHRLERAADGVFIDGYPDRPHAIDAARLQGDFGPAVDALAQTLKAMRSYIILLESPDGAASKVVFRTRGTETRLEHVGQSLTLDGIDHEADAQLAATDFGPARTSTKQILDEGLPKLPHSYVALMANPLGPLGEVEILEGISQGVRLDQSGQAVIIDGYSSKIYALDEAQYRKDFGDSLTAMPPPPVTHLLYFDSGSVRLTADSRAIMPLILDDIRTHPAADVSIAGYTDTVGGEELNERLSHKRSEAIAVLIVKSGVPTQEISLAYFGKTALAVETPDNTPELLNRRVEITIR